MFHYVGNFKHWTAETKNGTFRSPCREMAHLVGTEIFDKKLKRNYQPRLLMDMEVPFREIFNRFPCAYTDDEIPFEDRVSELVCDLYNLNQKNSERVYASFYIALPNYLTVEQNTALSKDYGRFFSEKWKRPVIVSYHRIFNENNGENGNNIVYIISPYREYFKNKNWTQKSYSYFLDKAGNLIIDKKYKDKNGNDIRKPKVPKGEEPIYETDKDGHIICKNQLRREKNRLAWVRTRTSDMFCFKREQIKELNYDIDEVMNEFFRKNGIDDRVEHLRPGVRQKLKESGMSVLRYHGLPEEKKADVLENNAHYHRVANVMTTMEDRMKNLKKKIRNFESKQMVTSLKIKELVDAIKETDNRILENKKKLEELLSNMSEEERKELEKKVNELRKNKKEKFSMEEFLKE